MKVNVSDADMADMVDTPDGYDAQHLELACESIFGGVGACSPEIYETLIEKVAKMCGRSIDDKFREDVKIAIGKLPCPLD
ncbi:hypothetical protein UFOVP1229_166 [uncultured Caudovirales phage]|uniref:Uncharacterized protein n=1 Tax=uncultured Caudovirales phage TaxID=2100421 RepID=A0A6J5R3F8_9CAUD|nr:hypothetical protein UFOVP1229_166 [uncultured Caudovirales phage]